MNSRILPVVAVIIAALVFFGYTNPTYSGKITQTRAEIAADNNALDAAAAYSAKQNQLAAAKNALDPKALDRVEAFLPDSVDNVGLILDLDALASRSGLSLTSIDVAQDDAGAVVPADAARTPVSSVDLSISALGTYGSFRSFLSGIESSARLLDVRDLVVKGSDTGVYTYQLTVRLYWLR